MNLSNLNQITPLLLSFQKYFDQNGTNAVDHVQRKTILGSTNINIQKIRNDCIENFIFHEKNIFIYIVH